MKELKDCTTSELYGELCERSDVFSVQLWIRDDVESAFPNKSEEEIDEFMDLNSSSFNDRCTELGWEVMEALG